MISVVIPAYNQASLLERCINSVLHQSYQDFEIIVSDDASIDDVEGTIERFSDSRIHYFCNGRNVGYAQNLRLAVSRANGDIIFYLGQDDVLPFDSLERTFEAFNSSGAVAVVARPWVGFFGDYTNARMYTHYQSASGSGESLFGLDDAECLRIIFCTGGQFSGLAYRKQFATIPPGEDVFTSHLYPVIDALKSGMLKYLSLPNVAIQLDSSMTRHNFPEIYSPSPMFTWLQMWRVLLPESGHEDVRNNIIRFSIVNNLAILEHLKIVVGRRAVINEAKVIVGSFPAVVRSPKLLFHLALAILVPGPVLRSLSDSLRLSSWTPSAIRAKRVIAAMDFRHMPPPAN